MATNGKLDDVPTPRVKEFEKQFYRFLETERPEILQELGETKAADRRARRRPSTTAIDAFKPDVPGLGTG